MKRLQALATLFHGARITLELPKEEYEALRGELSYHPEYTGESIMAEKIGETEFVIKLQQ